MSCILPYTESERALILQEYGRTLESVKEDVRFIQEWMSKQPHLPEIADANLVERFLLLNKFRIEITKQKLDMYYTVRTILPELYAKDPSSPEIQKSMDVVYYLTLPKFTKENYRVTVIKLKDTNPDNFDPVAFVIHSLSVCDVRLREDYNSSELQVVDFSGITLAHLIKFNPIFVRKCGLIVQKVFSNRVTGIHFINTPPFTESFIYLLKAVLNPKIIQRVHIHKGSDTLKTLIPPEVLPKELGGTEKSLDEINDDWRRKLLEYEPIFQEMRKLTVNESLRAEKCSVDEFFGTEGSFRKLDLD